MLLRRRGFAIALLILVISAGYASAQEDSQFIFAEEYSFTQDHISALAAGDFNGDGIPDIVVATESDGIHILLGKANGGFRVSRKYPAEESPTAVSAMDVNGDGKLDIIVTGGSSGIGKVSVLLGNGDGTFEPRFSYPLPGLGISLALGDFNGDGHPDLAIGLRRSGNSGMAVLLNNGNGTFGEPTTYATGIAPSSVAVGDFNRDGSIDLLFVSGESVNLLLGNGNGTFQRPFLINLDIAATSIAVGDFNGDGKPDFVVAGDWDYSFGSVDVALGNGDGTFQPGVIYPSGGSDCFSVVVADLNGDGKLDFAALNNSDDVSIFFGLGDGTFRPAVRYRTASPPKFEIGGLAVAASAAGQRTDLAVSASPPEGGSDVNVLIGDGKGHFQAARDYLLGDPTEYIFTDNIAFGDLNGDGKIDMAIADSQGVAIFMNAGRGSFRPNKHYGLPGSGVALADFNGDGKLDLVSGFDQEIGIMLGKGNGAFYHLVTYPINGRIASYAVGDFNGDGNLDIAAADNYYGHVYVLLGKGDGTFRAPVSYTTLRPPSTILVGDLNGDGIPDLYVTGWNGGPFPGEVLLGNGDGTFQHAMLSGDPGGVTAVLADFNGDGKLDVALGSYSDSNIWVALGKGDGTFLPAQSYAALSGACCVVAADFNRDGRLDIAVGDDGAESVSVLYGNGDGTFQNAISFDACQVWAMGTSDLDGDGTPDLAIIDPTVGYGAGGSTVAVALNRRGR